MTELESLLQRTHPELIPFCRDRDPTLGCFNSSNHPTSTLLGRARPETLVRFPGVTTKTAETIIAAAKTSVASLTDPYTQRASKRWRPICAKPENALRSIVGRSSR
ncbi:MAG: hypothetical protein IPP94_18875 [Ignavibacteria bacterium]|nr:hypothetical protein [Ignavibacteria bacterium]